MVNKAERIRNCGARFFMCLAETFGAHVHHKKKKKKKKEKQAPCKFFAEIMHLIVCCK